MTLAWELGALPRASERVGRYTVVAEVAHGGMAAVYAAKLEHASGFGKLYALKLLLPSLASERRFVDMFMDEARIAAQLQHPHLVQVFDIGEHRGLPFMVMEYLRGQSFSQVLRRGRTGPLALPPALALEILAQACAGLHSAHELRSVDGELLHVVHRDVSPQNIHVSYDGTTKVVDFGIAAARGRVTKTQTGELKGKLSYIAPEQVRRGAECTRQADLWAIGVMAWEIMARRSLFRGADDAETLWNVLHKAVPDLGELAPELSSEVVEVVMQCLQRDPLARPATAAALGRVLGLAASSLRPNAAEELAGWVCEAFVAEKTREDERLSAALRDRLPALQAPEPDSGRVRVQLQPAEGRTIVERRPRALTMGTMAGALLGAFALGWWLLAEEVGARPETRGPGSAARSTPVADPGRPSTGAAAAGIAAEQPAVAEASAAATAEGRGRAEILARSSGLPASPDGAGLTVPVAAATVHASVSEDIRLVLVDGVIHSERPLEIRIPFGGSSVVTLVGSDGRMQERTISEADEGAELGLLSPEASPGSHARRVRRDARSRGAPGSLLPSPYRR